MRAVPTASRGLYSVLQRYDENKKKKKKRVISQKNGDINLRDPSSRRVVLLTVVTPSCCHQHHANIITILLFSRDHCCAVRTSTGEQLYCGWRLRVQTNRQELYCCFVSVVLPEG